MIVLIFNLIITLILMTIFYDFKKGFVLLVLYKIVTPGYIDFRLGAFRFPFFVVAVLALLLSFYIHKSKRNIRFPKKLKLYYGVGIISTFILILLSARVVPISYQIYSFFKEYIIQDVVLCIIGFYAIADMDRKQFLSLIFTTSIWIGIYGIITYIIHFNPYVNILSLTYSGEEEAALFFADSVRGGLSGRIYGTLNHPLAWGQYWNILISFSLFFKNTITKKKFYAVQFLGILNCLFSGSRTAIICLAVAYFFYLLSGGLKNALQKIVIAFCLIIAVNTFFLPQKSPLKTYIESAIYFWDDKYARAANVTGSNANMRDSQLDETIKIGNNNIAGLGYNFQMYELDNTKVSIPELLGLESIVFKKVVEQGYIGFIIWLFLFALFYKVLKNKEKGISGCSKNFLLEGYFGSFLLSLSFTGQQGISIFVFSIFSFIYYHFISYDSKNNSLLLVRQKAKTSKGA